MIALISNPAGAPAPRLPKIALDPGPVPLFRKLRAEDREALEAHFCRLGPDERRMRFCGSVGEESVRAHCRALDWKSSVLIGCFVAGQLRGVAELSPEASGTPRRAEFALTVELPYQGRGLGTELLRRSLVAARNRAVAVVTMICLLENLRMRTIARKFDTVLHVEEDSVEGHLKTAWPTLASLLEELSWDGVAALRTMAEA
jgi:RimJ/RimL family protein N-acetyltransferase